MEYFYLKAMIFGYFTLFVALTISAIAEYYSIIGLTAIFSAAFWPVVIMGAALGVGKLTATVWLKLNWDRAPWAYKLYLVPSVSILMVLTSLGCFGFLSKAHSDQSLVSGDSIAKVAIYDEKIGTAKDNIATNRRALKQMDEAVDQVMGRSDDAQGADKAVAIRRGQGKERARLLAEIENEQRKVAQLSEERAPLAAEYRKVESEVGPIKYIAALVYGDNPDANILEKAVRLVIILIVAVLDPLALVLVLAGQQSLRWGKEEASVNAFVEQAAIETIKDIEQQEEKAIGMDVGEPPPAAEEDLQEETPVEDQGAVAVAAVADAEPIAQAVTTEPQTTVDPFAYLKQPFVHFENLKPMVAKPEPQPEIEIYSGNPDDFKEPWSEEDKANLVKAMESFFAKNRELAEVEPQEEDTSVEMTKDTQAEEIQTSEGELEAPQILTLGVSDVERPGDYLTEPEYTGPMKEVIEEHIDPNTRIKTFNHRWVPDLLAQADNEITKDPAQSGFGDQFPTTPSKGDTYLRVDYLPAKLFKYNGAKWMEVDKNSTDSYAYNREYIKYLIDRINSGEYSIDDLSDSEQEQIAEYLNNDD